MSKTFAGDELGHLLEMSWDQSYQHIRARAFRNGSSTIRFTGH